jgi:hypothetical protein
MLTSNPSLSNAISNPRQIAISSSAPAVLYTVPAGRKFVGHIYAVSNTAPYSLTTPNGVQSGHTGGALQIASASTQPIQIVLIAGTSITGQGIDTRILGVESDL